ncbi:MAG TPA: hypothetical protein VJ777_07890 [Mycobacterium sp.]|nr:hypothetical protein [Mycobacterium sp.]
MCRTLLLAVLLWALASPVSAQQLASGNLATTGESVQAQPTATTGAVSIQVAGTWSGTITFQGSVDGVTYVSALATNQTTGATSTTTTANAVFAMGNSGWQFIRAYGTSIASGRAVVTIVGGAGGSGGAGGGGGGGGSVTQGTVPWLVAGQGTAGTADTAVVTVQGIASMTPLLAAQSGNWATRTQDGSGNALASNANGGTRALAAVIYDGSGNAVTSFGGSGGTASNFGAAFPSAGTAAGLSDGTNMVASKADTDDASIAVSQVAQLTLAAQQVYDGSVWRRQTVGTAGTAAAQVTTIQGIASMTPVIATGSGTAGSAATGVLTVQGIASMTPVQVSQATAANLNATVVGTLAADGAAAATNRIGVLPAIVETGTLPTLTDGRNASLYVNTSGALFVTPTQGTFATDGTFDSAVPATGPSVGYRAETTTPGAMADGDLVYPWADTLGALSVRAAYDPCGQGAKTVIPINISTATTTEITPSLAGSGNYYYVCSINLGPTSAAQNAALVDDDSDNCGSVTSGMAGGTSAGSGWNIAANGGLTFGNGLGTVFKTNGTNRVICLVTSAAAQISGAITVVAAP